MIRRFAAVALAAAAIFSAAPAHASIIKEAPSTICYLKRVADTMSCVIVNWYVNSKTFVLEEKVTGWNGPLELYYLGAGPHPADEIYDGEVPNLHDYSQFTTIICGIWGPPGTKVCPR